MSTVLLSCVILWILVIVVVMGPHSPVVKSDTKDPSLVIVGVTWCQYSVTG